MKKIIILYLLLGFLFTGTLSAQVVKREVLPGNYPVVPLDFMYRMVGMYDKLVYRTVGDDGLSLPQAYGKFLETVREREIKHWNRDESEFLTPLPEDGWLEFWYDMLSFGYEYRLYFPRYTVNGDGVQVWWLQPLPMMQQLHRYVALANPFWEETRMLFFEMDESSWDRILEDHNGLDFDDIYERFLLVGMLMPTEFANRQFVFAAYLEQSDGFFEDRENTDTGRYPYYFHEIIPNK